MATKTEYFTGKCKWARTGQPDQWGWRVTLYPNEESTARFKQWQEQGLGTWLQRDEDGDYFTVRRYPEKDVMGKPTMIFGPPTVVDKENKICRELIGNGSEVTVKVSIYDYSFKGKKGKGMRLEGIRIEDLVPYVSKQEISGTVPKQEIPTPGF